MDYGKELVNFFASKSKPMTDMFFRKRDKIERLKVGIPAIDDPSQGLINTDFWVIGANTGAGKTQLCLNVAVNIAKQGKKVLMFLLEGYHGEFEDRYKWSLITSKYYEKNSNPIFYKPWICGEYDFLEPIEREVEKEVDQKVLDNISVRYREVSEDYTINTMNDDLDRAKNSGNYDLVIIDHLHFFKMSDDKANIAIEKLVKRLRDIGLHYKLPIILVSHLRRKERGSKAICPNEHDLHGSSEIEKCATGVIILSRAYGIEPIGSGFPTYFRTCKERMSNAGQQYVNCCMFDIKTNRYSQQYKVYRLKNYDIDSEELEMREIPNWAENASNINKVTGGSFGY